MDLHKLFTDVFHPEPDETVAVIADVPHGELRDSETWRERREMAAEWRAAWISLGEQIGFDVLPLITFPATGAHNGNLPLDKGEPIPLRDGLSQATIALSLTQYSATAPLSMPGRVHTMIFAPHHCQALLDAWKKPRSLRIIPKWRAAVRY